MNTISPELNLDIKSEIEPLIHKLNPSCTGKGAVLTFIAARPKEGTSTVAKGFALAMHEAGKRVLLIGNDEGMSGIVEAVAAGQDIATVLSTTDEGFIIGNWAATAEGLAHSTKLVQEPDFWKSIRTAFDIIVIDAPSLRKANEGVAYAQVSNATILVVAAETTRKQVVENLRDTLTAAGAKIAGMILNKRIFHIPQKVYDRL
jgi:Mrp family chromosome partitioning ATPase